MLWPKKRLDLFIVSKASSYRDKVAPVGRPKENSFVKSPVAFTRPLALLSPFYKNNLSGDIIAAILCHFLIFTRQFHRVNVMKTLINEITSMSLVIQFHAKTTQEIPSS